MTTPSTGKNSQDGSMTFIEHLVELRRRLLRSLVAMVVGMIVCWIFREELLQLLQAPLYTAWRSVPGLPEPTPLSFKSLMEPFVAYLKLSGVGGIFIAAPVIFYQIWRFVAPGLYKREKRIAVPFVFVSSVLFIVGSLAAYMFVFPIGFSFFLKFSSGAEVEQHSAEVAVVAQKRTSTTPAQSLPVPSVASSPSSADKALRLAKQLLGGKQCSYFTVLNNGDGTVKVKYIYNQQRCGDKSLELALLRNGRKVAVEFEQLQEGPRRYYTFTDVGPPRKSMKYELTVTHMASNKLVPTLMVKDYLGFALKLLLAFGLVFEVPVLIFFLAYAGLVTAGQLLRFGRWFVVLSVVLAAMLTPPDVVTQVLLATPLIVLYFLSVLLVYLVNRSGDKRSED